MKMDNKGYEGLNPIQIDMLKEIGNIGAGNAATALSVMLSQRVDMTSPKVRIIDINEITYLLGGPENLVVGIFFVLSKDIEGMMMFLLEKDFAHLILNLLMGHDFKDFSELEEIHLSAIREIGNIMAGSYVNALSTLTNMEIQISVPDVAIDMAGAILSVPAIKFGEISDKLLLIEEEFNGESDHLNSYLLMIPEIESLHKILKTFGMEI